MYLSQTWAQYSVTFVHTAGDSGGTGTDHDVRFSFWLDETVGSYWLDVATVTLTPAAPAVFARAFECGMVRMHIHINMDTQVNMTHAHRIYTYTHT